MYWSRVRCFVGQLDVGQIVRRTVLETAQVVEGVVAQAVPLLHHHAEHGRMLAHVVAHHEEGRLDAILAQHAQHPGSHLGYGSVVKSEINGFLLGAHTPQGGRIEFAKQSRRLFNEHGMYCDFVLWRKDLARLVNKKKKRSVPRIAAARSFSIFVSTGNLLAAYARRRACKVR